jgi:hypothetical protein
MYLKIYSGPLGFLGVAQSKECLKSIRCVVLC